MSRSTYYYHETHETADRQSLERPVIREICLGADMRYGYRRVASELKRRTGLCLSGKTVLKVMREEGLTCARRRRRKYRSYAGKVGKVAPNLLGRSFRAAAPMTKLVTDVTEFKVAGRKLYLSPVIDLFNDEVVAYSMSTSPNMRMVQEMLERLEPRIPDGAMPLMHSDQGWQYQMPSYVQALQRMGIIQSMSRKDNCLDNSKAENFFSMLKTELYFDWEGESVHELEIAVRDYIDWYNKRRVKMGLKGKSPVEYRLDWAA